MTMPTADLAGYLKRHDESARAFALRAKVHYSRISRYLSGESTPSLAVARLIELATSGEVPLAAWPVKRASRRSRRRASRSTRHIRSLADRPADS